MKRTRLNPVSKKRQALMSERSQCRQTVLERAQGRCEARIGGMCTKWATDVHEVKTRGRGGSITNPDNCRALCRMCHTFITGNPKWSGENGWTKHSWDEE